MGLCELENAQCPKTSVHIELNSINCHFEGLLKVFLMQNLLISFDALLLFRL